MEEIGRILPIIFKSQLSRPEPPVLEVLKALWIRVAGKALARQCQPVAFSAGTLTLATNDAEWAEPLQQMAEEIRARVNEFLGKSLVRQLKVLRVRKVRYDSESRRNSEIIPATRTRVVSSMASDLTQMIERSYTK